jgi:CRP/FNR family transcriptional regulator
MYARTIAVPPDHATDAASSLALPVPQLLRSLFACQPIERHDADTVVFWEGDDVAHVYEVVEGVLRIVKSLSGGRRVVIGFRYPGELLGVFVRNPHLHSAEAATAARLRRCDRAHFEREMVRRPDLNRQMQARLCEDVEAAQDQMLLLARKTAEERVCSFLLQMVRREAGGRTAGPVVEIVVTRHDIADYLGLTKETLSRVMGRLTGLGVISMVGSRTIVIRAFERLEAHAGDGCEADGVT